MRNSIGQLAAFRIVQRCVKAVQPITYAIRRILKPGVSPIHLVTTVGYKNHRYKVLHRRWSPGDKLAIQQCFHQKQYEVPKGVHSGIVQDSYRRIVSSKSVPLIIDCGANIGCSALWFAATYPEAHIVAIEPALENLPFLQKNCQDLNIDIRHAGIGPADGSAFVVDKGGDMSFQTSVNETDQRVEIISLSMVLKSKPETRYTPFLLKMDIEGAEADLFDGDCSDFDRFPVIFFEPHDWLEPGLTCSIGFFRFHSTAKRAFNMNDENVISIRCTDENQESTT